MDYQLGPGPLQVDQNTIDEKIKGDIGIVENGNVATHAIPSGYYVIWKGDLYVAKTDISSGTTLSTSNLTAKPNGIGAEVAKLNSNFGMYTLGVNQDLLDIARDTTICPENTVKWINCRNGVVSNLNNGNYGVACVTKRVSSAVSITLYKDDGTIYRTYWNNTNQKWISWEQLALNSNSMMKRGIVNSIASDTAILNYDPGTYQIALSTSSTYMPDRYGTLTVLDSGDVYKSFIFVKTATNTMYNRVGHKTNGTWYGDWKELAAASNTPKLTIVDQNLPINEDYMVTLTNGIYLLVTCKPLNTTIASSLHIIFANQYGSTLKTITDAPNISVTVNKLSITLHTDTEYVKASFIKMTD